MWRDLLDFIKAVITSFAGYLTGGVVVATWLIYERLVNKPISLRAFIAGIIVYLFVSFFTAWRTQRNTVRDTNREIKSLKSQVADLTRALALEREQPHFIGSIGQVATARFTSNVAFGGNVVCPIVFMQMSIQNTGAPSIATGWSLKLEGPAIDITVPPAYFSEETPLSGDSVEGIIKPGDFLYEKTVQPIPRYGIVSGWLAFVVEGAEMGTTNAPGTKFAVSFKDARGNIYTVGGEFDQTPARLRHVPGATSVIKPKKGKTGRRDGRQKHSAKLPAA